jgi:hypothetical protein
MLSDIVDKLDSDLLITHTCANNLVKKGWKLIEVNHRAIANQSAAQTLTTKGLGFAWSRFADPEGQEVTISKYTQESAQVWLHALVPRMRYIPFMGYHHQPGAGYADAFATPDSAGIGGWYSTDGTDNVQTIRWFQIAVNTKAFPTSWEINSNLQNNIAFWEVIA